LDNLAKFPPLAVILVMLLGVSVAEKSGLLEALLRITVVRLCPSPSRSRSSS